MWQTNTCKIPSKSRPSIFGCRPFRRNHLKQALLCFIVTNNFFYLSPQASLPPSTNNTLTNNPNIPTPTNIPTPVNLPPVSSSSSPGNRMFPNTPGGGGGGAGGGGPQGGGQNTPSDLDLLGLTMELLDPSKWCFIFILTFLHNGMFSHVRDFCFVLFYFF